MYSLGVASAKRRSYESAVNHIHDATSMKLPATLQQKWQPWKLLHVAEGFTPEHSEVTRKVKKEIQIITVQ